MVVRLVDLLLADANLGHAAALLQSRRHGCVHAKLVVSFPLFIQAAFEATRSHRPNNFVYRRGKLLADSQRARVLVSVLATIVCPVAEVSRTFYAAKHPTNKAYNRSDKAFSF